MRAEQLTDPAALDRFRAMLAADEAPQDALAQHEAREAFVEAALALAGRRGIALAPGDLEPFVAPDPLQLARFDPPQVRSAAWPPREWLPFQVADGVDWAHFAAAPTGPSFFANAARRALARPLNRLLRWRTGLDDFIDNAPDALRAPDGLIFHMSRCGSTLVSRMLGALPEAAVVTEPAPLDSIVHLALRGDWPEARRIAAVRAMVGALGRRRAGRYFVKLNAWHALALPLFRAAFPAVPWLFLYREPAEILASQMKERGTEMTPEIMPSRLYGIDGGTGLAGEVYCALVLERIAKAALSESDGGLFVDHADLPGAVAGAILPHFGVGPGEIGHASLDSIAGRDAKRPARPFAATRPAIAPEVRAAADAHLAAIHAGLKAVHRPQSLL
jgi:hypothetical protein